MTIDERVEWCLDQKGGRPLFGDEARVIIKQAINAAVEEEREACAKIAVDFREEAGRADCGAEFYKTASAVIRDRIRARSVK